MDRAPFSCLAGNAGLGSWDAPGILLGASARGVDLSVDEEGAHRRCFFCEVGRELSHFFVARRSLAKLIEAHGQLGCRLKALFGRAALVLPIRPPVGNRKVCGGNPTDRGAVAHAAMMSVIGTAAQHGVDVIEYCVTPLPPTQASPSSWASNGPT